MENKVYPTYSELSSAVANLIADYVTKKPQALICLASGHTPVGVFHVLKEKQQAGEVNLKACTFLSLDEWLGIDPTDPGSCLSMLQRDCFGPLNIAQKQIEFFNVHASDLQQECDRINALIEKNGGLDIMLVGVGTNGHIGMNEPGTAFDSVAHISTLAEETKSVGQKYFEQATPLSQGITLGLKHLREAKLPIVMASGVKKSEILGKALNGVATEAIPVSVVHLIPQVWVMVDEEAGSLMVRGDRS